MGVIPHAKHFDFSLAKDRQCGNTSRISLFFPFFNPWISAKHLSTNTKLLGLSKPKVSFPKGHGSSPAAEGSFRNFNLHLHVQNMNLEMQFSELIQGFGRLIFTVIAILTPCTSIFIHRQPGSLLPWDRGAQFRINRNWSSFISIFKYRIHERDVFIRKNAKRQRAT